MPSIRHSSATPVTRWREFVDRHRGSVALAAGIGAGAVAFLLGYAARIEPRRLQCRHVDVSLPDLSSELEGLRVAFLSDFHLHGPGHNNAITRDAFEAVARERPDLILLGGDFFDHAGWHKDGEALTLLRTIDAPIFGVLGNHDFRGDKGTPEAITRLLEQNGVCVLRNHSVSVRVRGLDVWITGVDDPYLGKAQLSPALAEAGERPLILLAHAPTIAADLPVAAADLVLTGHTHGGQIRLSPSNELTPLDISFYLDRVYHRPVSKFQRGFHWTRGTLLYVTNGIGVTRWPLRFMAPPEVVFMRLTRHLADSEAPCDSAERYVREIP